MEKDLSYHQYTCYRCHYLISCHTLFFFQSALCGPTLLHSPAGVLWTVLYLLLNVNARVVFQPLEPVKLSTPECAEVCKALFPDGVCGGTVGWGTSLQAGRLDSFPDGVIRIFYWLNPSGHTVALGLTQPVTEMCVMGVSWGLRQPLRQADTLLPSCIDCLEAAIRSYQGLYKEGFYWLFSHDNSSSYGNAICVCLLEPCSKRTYQFLQQLAFQLFLLICEIPAVGVFLVYGCSQLCSLWTLEVQTCSSTCHNFQRNVYHSS